MNVDYDSSSSITKLKPQRRRPRHPCRSKGRVSSHPQPIVQTSPRLRRCRSTTCRNRFESVWPARPPLLRSLFWRCCCVLRRLAPRAACPDPRRSPGAAPAPAADCILVGDLFYERSLAERLIAWLDGASPRCSVLIGDPGRSYLPTVRLKQIAAYEVPVTRDLEDAEIKRSAVWRLRD